MTNLKYTLWILALLLGLVSLTPAFALAQNVGAAVDTSASVTATAPGVSANANTSASASLGAAGTKAQGRGDTEITRRITALDALNTRVEAMQQVTDAFKTSLSATIEAQITALNTLKAKIDADTDLSTLKTDIQSVTSSYRVFALILPQGRIAAAADREVTIVSMMNTLGAKLQARIQSATSAGDNTAAVTAALQDMSAKVNDAQTQAEASVSVSASLQPDNGVASVEASNKAALKTARADIAAAQKDLVAARADITTAVNGLKAFPVSASASASSTGAVTP